MILKGKRSMHACMTKPWEVSIVSSNSIKVIMQAIFYFGEIQKILSACCLAYDELFIIDSKFPDDLDNVYLFFHSLIPHLSILYDPL